MASSRFRVDGTGGTVEPPPPLFLVRTRSLQAWPRLPSTVWVRRRNALFLCLTLKFLFWKLCCRVSARSRRGWTGGFRLLGVSVSICRAKSVRTSNDWCPLVREHLSSWAAKVSWPWEILCFRAGIRSYWTFAPRHAPLPSTASLFPPPLLETALTRMRAASNDALVQKTLHPPRIPKKSTPVQDKASSALSAADRGGNTPVVPRSQQSSQSTCFSSSSSRVRLPFCESPAGGKQKGSGKQPAWRACCSVAVGGPFWRRTGGGGRL